MSDPLKQLADEGVSVWLDDLGRHRLVSGSLERLVRSRAITGVTTNPTIFHNALRAVGDYDAELRDFAQLGFSAAEVVRLLTSQDVRAACDVLRPVFQETDGVDGRVSIEVDPQWVGDTQRTIAEARVLWWLVDRPNAMIKIPATPAGLPAITACLAEGISVNVTLIFSVERYYAVLDAFLAGLEAARGAGRDLSRIASVASFFVSRVDTAVDRRLDAIGGFEAGELRGSAAIANARLAYESYERMLRGQRWARLAEAGARPQRPLWASTGVKDPAYEDTRYVVELVAPGTVNTMPEPTLNAVADHGEIRGDRVSHSYAAARSVLDRLSALGVDLDGILAQLEQEGVAAFQASWLALLADVEIALGARTQVGGHHRIQDADDAAVDERVPRSNAR
ncbi:transaldolase [Nocardia noduli]|uniref:transaldolase n=1 Tax=Nocardia noduli TaxID=2815722 RepID=UPI001C2412E5|nr:transaldolase [Nocardia noduli]